MSDLKAAAGMARQYIALIQDIQEMESRAHRLGLPITARALNNAKNTCGLEIAGDTGRARGANE